jgi:hypothetical protein
LIFQKILRDAILEIWSVLKDADRRLIIYPWHQSAHGRYKALSDMSKFPKKKETLVRYFKDAYFRPHAGPMYIRVYLGCDLTMEELGKQTSGLFNSPKNRSRVGFWINPLQFKEIVQLCFRIWSSPTYPRKKESNPASREMQMNAPREFVGILNVWK